MGKGEIYKEPLAFLKNLNLPQNTKKDMAPITTIPITISGKKAIYHGGGGGDNSTVEELFAGINVPGGKYTGPKGVPFIGYIVVVVTVLCHLKKDCP